MSNRGFVRPITRELADLVPLTPAEIDQVSGGSDPVDIPDDTVTWSWTRTGDGRWVRSDGPY